MGFLQLFILALLVLCAPLSARAQDTEILKINDHLHVLVSPQGGNVAASSGEDGLFIIDDQLQGRSEAIEDKLKTLSDKGVQFILNTHYHFDHTGGNEFFGGQGAIIVSHDNVRKRLSTEQFMTYFKKTMPALSKAGLPVVTFADGMSFHYNGDEIRVVHLPNAHTDGDAAAYFAHDNVLVAGDLIFNGMYPFIDAEHGGSVKGVIAGIGRFLEMADDKTIIVPGHGPLMNKAEMAAYRDVLVTIASRVEAGIKEGKTLEQVVADKPSEKFDAALGGGIIGPDAFIALLYEDLSRS